MLKLFMDYGVGGRKRRYIADQRWKMLVDEQIRKCAGFIGIDTSKGFTLCGTCFFVFISEENDQIYFTYLITSRHVINEIKLLGKETLYLRLNTKEGAQKFPVNIKEWIFHPNDNSIDVAVLRVSPPLLDEIDYLAIPVSGRLTSSIINDKNVGVGDEVFSTGLFINHPGQQKNNPIIRIGNICLFPEDKIETAKMGIIDAILIEARSTGGLSGSPVFVNIGGTRGNITYAGSRVYWLGMIHGHWEIKRPNPILDTLEEGEFVNKGIAIVIPVSKIMEVLNQGMLIEERTKQISEWKMEKSPTMD